MNTEQLIGCVKDKNQAAAWVRSEANVLIEQAERFARGWDKGMYRDDDTLRDQTITQRIRTSVDLSFALSKKFTD